MNSNATYIEFTEKFNELSAQNQKYIIAMQQALIYAQTHENTECKITPSIAQLEYQK